LIEIGEVLSLDDKASVYSTGNLIFKCVGMGIMDLAISRKLLELAQKSGIGSQEGGF
jgi:ornithine cyclodeaminase